MNKKIKAVIDTNIFISALLGSKTCKAICDSFQKQLFSLVLSEFIIKELRDVLTNKELGNISFDDVTILFKVISTKAIIAKPKEKINLCRDPQDNKVLEAASEGADFIVSGDKDLLTLKTFRHIPIITPKEFLKHIE